MYDMRACILSTLHFVEPATGAVLFVLGLQIFNPGVLCPIDVPTLRFASQLFVDPAPGAVFISVASS